MKKIVQGLMMVGGIMTLAGAAFYITGWFLSPYIYIIGIILLYVIIMVLKVLIKTCDKRANDNIYKDYPSKGRKD